MKKLIKNLEQTKYLIEIFIYGMKKESAWIINPDFKIYIRKSIRYINLDFRKTIDIAVIEIVKPTFRSRGYGSTILNHTHQVPSDFEYTFIECVQYDFLKKWLLKNEWIPLNDNDENFYKKRTNK